MIMMHKLHKVFAASCLAGIAVLGAAPAYADTTHGFDCTSSSRSPGNAATSPGSFFNEPGVNSLSGGKGNQAANTTARQGAGAPSQYDTACGRVSANGTGTPVQTTTPTADITNNARDTRAISHTGNGATK
jgi:hypothetical protein